jgi:hypothetical protein
MLRQFRVPGPLGLSPGGAGSRPPGPLRVEPGAQAAPKQVARVVKKLGMPPPDDTAGITKVARKVLWPLFANGTPALDEVEQGALANCPLAAVLAALAYTPNGRKHLLGLVQEHGGDVETDLSKVADQLDEPPPQGNKLSSKRYFSVALGGTTFEVSDVLYTDEARDPTPKYMRSPKQVFWPCVIEKAYAEKEGGYGALNKLSANAVWEVVVGSKPDGFAVTADNASTRQQIVGAATNAATVATLAASRDDAVAVPPWHGFAVLGMERNRVRLHDPSGMTRYTLSLEDFIKNFKAVLHQR